LEKPEPSHPQTVTPPERPPWVKPGASMFDIIQNPEYLVKYPWMKNHVKRMIEKEKKRTQK